MKPTLEITKSVSSPIAADAPSFLKTFPPEIRNAIYDVLFKRYTPVLIRSQEPSKLKEPSQEDFEDDEQDLYEERLRVYQALQEAERKVNAEFDYGFQHALPFLRCCREIYHETVGVLYGQNTFVITRPLGPHDYEAAEMMHGYHQIDHTPVWLSGLGSQKKLLNKVIVDVDATCHLVCTLTEFSFDLLPLLRLLWSEPKLLDVVSFGHTGRFLVDHSVSNTYSSNVAITQNNKGDNDDPIRDLAIYFNRVVCTLGKNDALQIKRYAYSRRLLSSVNIFDQGGSVYFEKTSITEYEERISFDLTEDGTMSRVRYANDDRIKWGLPRCVLRRVYDFLCVRTDDIDIDIDLDAHTVHGLDVSFLYADFATQQAIVAKIASVCHLTVRMATSSHCTDVGGFSTLKDKALLKNMPHSIWIPGPLIQQLLERPTDSTQPTTFLLKFDLAPEKTSAGIKINIKELVKFLSKYPPPESSTIEFVLGNYKDCASVTVVDLEQRLFLLLAEFAMQITAEHLRNCDVTLPDIWIDGYGNLIKTEFSTPGYRSYTLEYSHTELDADSVRQKGWQMARVLKQQRLQYVPRRRTGSRTNLLGVWYTLCDKLMYLFGE